MRLPLLALFAAFASFLTACGSPMAGTTCNTTGFLCESAASALECRVGTWTSLPCKGPNGCKREGDVVKCDMTGNAENDNCASSAEGKGLCTSDGQGTLECRDGKLVKTNTCRTCMVSGDLVTCQP
ncbi:MAG: hypothetical protein QM817_16780 [Archangium sp.]